MNFQYKNITLGSDPEFFIRNKEDKLISSIGIIQGSKYVPQQLPELGNGFAIQTDNVLGEFNIPVCKTPHEATEKIAIMKAYISDFLAKEGLEPYYAASGNYEEDQLQSEQACAFGCDPDFNFWTGGMNERPIATDRSLRSAGFH